MSANISVMVADDSKQFRDSVRTMLEFEKGIVVSGEAEDGLQAVQLAKMIKPDVILMDVNMPGMDGIAATKAILAEVSTSVVMVSVQGESDYLRRAMQAGARDYLVKPFGYDDVVAAIRNAARSADLATLYGRETEKPEKAGKLITVFSTKGGVGKTTIAANLAVSLGLKSRGKVAIADLDLEFGVMTTMFGIRPDTSIVDLCRVDGPLRAELVERVMIPCSGRLVSVLPAPPSPENVAEVDGDARKSRDRNYVSEILDILKASYTYVVVDTACNFRETNLSALDRSDLILLVASPDIPTLHTTAKCLDILLHKLEYGENKVKLVLNRSDGAMGLTHEDISRGLDYPISYYVPSDGQTAIWAANSGQPFVLRRSKAPISEAIGGIAQDIYQPAKAIPERVVSATGKRRGIFGLLGG